ncbi:NAD-dependent epimerase/dehydratase family protein [Tellurirhabdus bombi]|uniref:NAD-dependent epimerase/dehydratase family protein n=1 Tax=Tellurirhabdus bombi TaxID=2907205 RepID=UPI001F2F3C89|nr:NAD-dependent epimerase/dehydratase family protein [Tellurirhabdus bombi]
MKVLLTGATGLLGLHIARELLRQGYAVKALYRSLPQAYTNLPWFGEIEWVKGNIAAASDVQKSLRGCQALIHAAARTDPSPSDLASYYEANILSTEIMLAAAEAMGIERFVYVSTAAVFRPGSLAVPATEESPFAFHLMDSGYIASKYQAQQLVLKAVNAGLNAVIVNPAFMLGPYDLKPSSGAIIQHVLRSKHVFYPGSGGKSFIDVRDAARATVNALRQGKTGNSYLLANENISYDRFFSLVAELSGRKKRLFPVPASVLRSVGNLGSVGERVLRRPLRLNSINAVLMTQDNYYSGAKARNELAMPMSPVRQAIEDAIDWFSATKPI